MATLVPTYDGPPPAGYVPGKGRGATGFTTRSDVGSAAVPPEGEGGQYEDGDEEADKIYAAVDERVESMKRKRKRAQGAVDDAAQSSGKISDDFKDLKAKLGTVTEQEWAALPEVSDRKVKRKAVQDVFTPLMDSVYKSNAEKMADSKERDVQGEEQSGEGAGLDNLANARNKAISMTLKSISDSVGGQTNVDPKGYITSMKREKISTMAEVGDIKKARLLLKSVRGTNKNHGPGWIAAARVEEFAKDMKRARAIIREGCENCPNSEDVWLEAIRLSVNSDVAKSVAAHSIGVIPGSVKLYLKAADLEVSPKDKRTVLRRAIEAVPNSVKLWKEAIELESERDAKVMLSRAVECVPESVEIWLALARLETYQNARKVLNRARKALPGEVTIWVTAARLEEGQKNLSGVDKIVSKSVKALSLGVNAVVKREAWIGQAEACERGGSPGTASSIVRHSIPIGVEDEDRLRTWQGDADSFGESGLYNCAKSAYAVMLECFGRKKNLWIKAVELERKFGDKSSVEERLRSGVEAVPKATVLWLMLAKSMWSGGDVSGARNVLTSAFSANPNSEAVWLAGAKLERENGEHERARVLLSRARNNVDGPLVWMKSAVLERDTLNFADAIKMIEEGVKLYPKFDKFYMIAGQVCHSELHDVAGGRLWYQRGLEATQQKSIPIWKLLHELEVSVGSHSKARSLLELGRLKNPQSDSLWYYSVCLERSLGNSAGESSMLERGIKSCPRSGLLWSHKISTSGTFEKKRNSVDGIKMCPDSPLVITAVAREFMKDGKRDKARKWFERSVAVDPSYGDAYVHWYKLEAEKDDVGVENDGAKRVLDLVCRNEPKWGDLWVKCSKDWKRAKGDGRDVCRAAARGGWGM